MQLSRTGRAAAASWEREGGVCLLGYDTVGVIVVCATFVVGVTPELEVTLSPGVTGRLSVDGSPAGLSEGGAVMSVEARKGEGDQCRVGEGYSYCWLLPRGP